MYYLTTIIPSIKKDANYKYSNLIEQKNAGIL